MAAVLLYNIEKSKAIKIKLLCRQFFIEAYEVPKEDYGKKLSFILGLSDDDSEEAFEDFGEEMLYLADISDSFLPLFLNQLKRKKAPVSLKAVKTDVNISFTSAQLYSELVAEREAIAQGKRAHEQ